jgi:hypothetical protein
MCWHAILALCNGDLKNLSKTYKIECLKKISALIFKFILSRCDENDRYYWHEFQEATETLLVRMIEKNQEGRRHLIFVIDKEILGLINAINNIQNNEEKHHKYLEHRKQRKPQHHIHTHKKKHSRHSHDSSSSEDECDDD